MDNCVDLVGLFEAAGTKCYAASYGRNYAVHFGPRRLESLTVLEIGIGGYESPSEGGHSLKVWKQYFPNARIYGIDIVDKSHFDDERIKTFRGDQSDSAFLADVINEIGSPDIVIDDGSHRNDHVIRSFQILFPLMADCGIYSVEDVQFSYLPSLPNLPGHVRGQHPFWENYGGSLDINASHTMMAFFKRLADGLNYRDFINPGYQPNLYDKSIISVAFHRGHVFVTKGDNTATGHLCDANILKSSWMETMGVDSLDALNLVFPVIDDPSAR